MIVHPQELIVGEHAVCAEAADGIIKPAAITSIGTIH